MSCFCSGKLDVFNGGRFLTALWKVSVFGNISVAHVACRGQKNANCQVQLFLTWQLQEVGCWVMLLLLLGCCIDSHVTPDRTDWFSTQRSQIHCGRRRCSIQRSQIQSGRSRYSTQLSEMKNGNRRYFTQRYKYKMYGEDTLCSAHKYKMEGRYSMQRSQIMEGEDTLRGAHKYKTKGKDDWNGKCRLLRQSFLISHNSSTRFIKTKNGPW